MTSKDQLRRQAKGIAAAKAARPLLELEALSPDEIRRTLSNLYVHQAELELQNEELRCTQAELEASRTHYFDLYDHAPDGYLIINDEQLILEANLTAAELLGVDRSSLTKQAFVQFVSKEDSDTFIQLSQRLFKLAEPQAGDLRMLMKDGGVFWVHLSAKLAQDVDGAPVCRIRLCDITERKRAEEEMVQHLKHEEMLDNLGRELAGIIKMEAIYRIVAGSLANMGSFHDIGIELLDPDRGILNVVFVEIERKHIDVGQFSPVPYHPDNPVDGRSKAIASQKAVVINDLASRVRDGSEIPLRSSVDPQCAIYVPIITEGRVNGLLVLQSSTKNVCSERDISWLEGAAHLLSLAIDNARLYIEVQRTAVAEERNRLAGELHDAVSQILFASNITASSLLRALDTNPAKLKSGLIRLQQLNKGALAEMRTLLMELRPATLLKSNLKVLLTQLADSSAGRSPAKIIVNLDDVPALPSDVHIACYRITQEAINNIIKHANARQVTIALRTNGAGVDLEISDDGCGFDPDLVTADHQGLQIMRERAEKLGMSLELNTQMGQGTQVLVHWYGETFRKEAV
jgi:PAS domain S-box-containing protein